MELSKIVSALNKIAPINLAAKWDNVGLLVEPSSPHIVKNVMITNDLTLDVLQESIKQNANMIVSYHPPIFAPLKRLGQKSWKERALVKAIENKIAIYSPHTASDAVSGGVNDWLAKGLGNLSSILPITENISNNFGGLLLCNKADEHHFAALKGKASRNAIPVMCAEQNTVLQLNAEGVCQVTDIMRSSNISSEEVKFFPEAGLSSSGTGAGRLCKLQKPVALKDIIDKIKGHLKLDHVRLALGIGKSIEDNVSTVALCAGSGSSVISGVEADLYLTGEMSHHEVLDATQNGVNVVLCEHSNTERGYLQVLKLELLEILGEGNLAITISSCDKDPLDIV